MKANVRKWSFALFVMCMMLVCPMQVQATEKNAMEEAKKVKIPSESFNAGAAVLLDLDISMADAQIVELVKSNTSEKSMEQVLDDKLVMAKVNKYVNVRENPTQESEKLGVLYRDCGGDILERKDGWTKIQSGKVIGWVKDDYLYFGLEAQELAQKVGLMVATSQTETLRVRKEASTQAGVLGLLAMGETLEVIEELDQWVCVSYEGATGYVAAQYVEVDFKIDQAESMEEIKAREAAEAEAKRHRMKEQVLATASEMDILSALIQCEAGGESYEGQIAVGSVVMNRVRSAAYPNTITEVIYASGQFSPANSTKMSTLILTGNIQESCRRAAQEVVNGVCNVGDLTHFRRKGKVEGLIIGNHVFY